MDLKQWIIGVLFIIDVYGSPGIANKVYRCTEVGDWKDAMRSCFDSGGSPISHQQLTENGNISLKATLTYWTADVAVETQENSDHQSGLDPQVSVECQYASVNFRSVSNCNSSVINESNTTECRSFTLENPEFGDCKTERGCICNYPLINVDSLYAVQTNWNNSKHICCANLSLAKFGNQTRNGYIYGFDNRLDVLTVWLDQVRTHDIQVVNNRNAIDCLDIIKHGTVNLHDGFELMPSGKDYNLTAICVFENASIAEMNLTSDCLEGYDNADVGEIVSSTSSNVNYLLIASVAIATLMVSITIGIIVRCRNVNRGIETVTCSHDAIKRENTIRRGKNSPPSNRVDIPLQPEPMVAAPEPEYVNRQELRVVVNSMYDATYANSSELHDYDETEDETSLSMECMYSNAATLTDESTVQPRVMSNSSGYATASDKDQQFSKRGTLHIYDRANFQDGESLYDVAK